MSWFPVKTDHGMGEGCRRVVYQLSSAEDIAAPPDPDPSSVGSVAYTADMTGFWVKDNDGTWTESTADALNLISLI